MRAHTTFANYTPYHLTQKVALGKLQEFAERVALNRKENEGNLVTSGAQLWILEGRPGTGKSHLLEAFHRHLTPTPVNAGVIPPSVLITKKMGLVFSVMDPIFVQNSKVVLVDDFLQDEEHLNPHGHEMNTLRQLVHMAYQHNMLVLVATNHPTAQILQALTLGEHHGRIHSRLEEMTRQGNNLYKIEGPDGRKTQTSPL